MAKKNYDALYKLLLIGDSGVGKTCLLLRYVEDTFSSSFISTIGIDFKIKTIELEGKKIKLQIWDTAGQERFQTITVSYYRCAMGVMLVYDITNKTSFDSIARWMSNIDSWAACDVERLIVANKCDKSDQRAVPDREVAELSERYQVKVIETSAKGRINVDKAFEELTLAILRKAPREPENPSIVLGQHVAEAPEKSSSCFGCTY